MIPTLFENTKIMRSGFGSAMRCVVEGLREQGGRVLVFQASLPTEGLGKLYSRENLKLYGTEEEKSMYMPEASQTFYSDLGREAVKLYIGFDLFICSASFVDISTCSKRSVLDFSVTRPPSLTTPRRPTSEIDRRSSQALSGLCWFSGRGCFFHNTQSPKGSND